MNKAIKKNLLLLLAMILLSSCAVRRLENLDRKKTMAQMEKSGPILSDGSFYPDKIDDFTIDEYIKWYKSLKDPVKLKLNSPQKVKPLTKEEKVEDFNFFFKEIKENYPFFNVLKREYGIDFIANYSKYLKEVDKADTDEKFLETMKKIASDLKNGHTKIANKEYVENTLDYYAEKWKTPSIYYEFINLNKQTVRNRYQIEGRQSDTQASLDKRRALLFENDDSNNIQLEKLESNIALLKIKKMKGPESYDKDSKIIEEFLKNKDIYKALIIDIRGNTGGNYDYWKNFLLPKLVVRQKSVTNRMFIKDSEKSKLIFEDETINVERIKNVDLSAIDLDYREDIDNFDYYIKEDITINPDKTDDLYGFDKPIFLLVDEKVFSAAEGFANFMKYSSQATLVGVTTGGDGITLGVINSVMPNSGLVFTYTNTLGYDPKGAINQENPTNPDIISNSYKNSITTIEKMVKDKEESSK